MNRKIGYFMAKVISKIKREKHKESINRWFEKQGVKLAGGGVQDGSISAQILL